MTSQRDTPSLPRGSGETVLIVEDDSALRRMAGIQLRSLGYNVLEAEDASTALRVLQAQPGVDLLLTDVVMPGGSSGAELGLKARDMRPDLKLMYMSGFPRPRTEDHLPSGGDVVLLRKPFRLKEIASKVREALAAN